MVDPDELAEIDEGLRHHRASLVRFEEQGDDRFAAIARRKLDELLERRYALQGDLDLELAALVDSGPA